MPEAVGADEEHDEDGGVVHGVHHGAGRERMEAQARDAQHHADGEEHGERRKGVGQLSAMQHGEADAGDDGGEDQGGHAPSRVGNVIVSLRTLGIPIYLGIKVRAHPMGDASPETRLPMANPLMTVLRGT